MKTEFKHSYKEFSIDAIKNRVQKMVEKRVAVDVAQEHVRISTGNRKTGALVPSVSLIPISDCKNCKACKAGCYDVRNVCYLPSVQNSRAINSAIYAADPVRYFAEIREIVRPLKFFRWHVGGDLKDQFYLKNVVDIARDTAGCEFLIFTKCFDLVNTWIDKNGALPENLHLIFSDWRDMDMNNRHNLPVSSPIFPDGSTGEHVTKKSFICPGFCEDCAFNNMGCWNAKKR